MSARAAVRRSELVLAAAAVTAFLLAAIVSLDALATAGLVAIAVGLAIAPDDPAAEPIAALALAAPSLLACRRRSRA